MDGRRDVVFLEVLTSGLDPARDAPVAIAAARFRGDTLQEDLALDVRSVDPPPGTDWPPAGPRMRREIELDDALERLAAFVGSDAVAAHDLTRIRSLLRLHGLALGAGIDTLPMARILLPLAREVDLQPLAESLGTPLSPAGLGSALDRALATHALLGALRRVAAGLPAGTLEAIVAMGERACWPQVDAFRQLAPVRPTRRSGAAGRAGSRSGGRSATAREADSPAAEPPATARATRSAEGAGMTGPIPTVPAPTPGPSRDPVAIDVEQVESVLSPGGELTRRLPTFEDRPEQRAMLRLVAEALNAGDQLLVEAGTGTGKSLAYLLPAAAWAMANGRPVIVATHTINLQDQLLNHDLPLVKQLVGHDLRACLQKGRPNYLCRSRLEHQLGRHDLDPLHVPILARLLVWAGSTTTGDRAELGLDPAEETVWRSVSADSSGCLGERCRYAASGGCWVARVREQAAASHIVVANHALLISDMLLDHRLLPPHSALIVDEAHHLEDVATTALGSTVSSRLVRETLNQLTDEAGRGILDTIVTPGRHPVIDAATSDKVRPSAALLQAEVREAKLACDALFDSLESFLAAHGGSEAAHARITSAVRSQPDWLLVETAWQPFDASVQALRRSLPRFVARLVAEGREPQQSAMAIAQLQAASRALAEHAFALQRGLVRPSAQDVVWARRERGRGATLHLAPLSVAEALTLQLFASQQTVILTSATLRAGGGFDYLRTRLGLPDAPGHAIDSPFDYRRAVLALMPADMPEPDLPGYQDALDQVVSAVAADLGGRTLVLYTSHSALQTTYHRLRTPLGGAGVAVRGQGLDGDRSRLVGEFRQPSARTLLLGTRSFWEGIDVPGAALSCVVIARLPFDVPTDPVFEARAETYEDPFRQYILPRAVLRFRQGFGRLIRGASDLGVFVVLDSRIRQRGYGQVFLDALPDCDRRFPPLARVPALARTFLESAGSTPADRDRRTTATLTQEDGGWD